MGRVRNIQHRKLHSLLTLYVEEHATVIAGMQEHAIAAFPRHGGKTRGRHQHQSVGRLGKGSRRSQDTTGNRRGNGQPHSLNDYVDQLHDAISFEVAS
jgi:hypothetical protein